MIPLFKSDFSIGKSILRIDQDSYENGNPNNIFNILKENNLSQLFLVEDSMCGFLEARKNSINLGIDFIFGLRISLCEDEDCEVFHKVIIFSKNSNGCKLLNKISTYINLENNGVIKLNDLKDFWDSQCLSLFIPFYDSFIYQNIMSFSSVFVDLSFFNPIFLIESNDLPFDNLIKDSVLKYCNNNSFNLMNCKSVFYKNYNDFEAYQSYKCICNRNFSSKSVSLESPNLEHCSSNKFCFEDYIKYESS